jgi:glycosyltransferase involved in cell wall biosynthesis
LAKGSIQVLAHPSAEPPLNMAASARSPAGQLKLLFSSHLHPLKGAHILLEAVARLGEGSGVSVDLFGGFSTEEYEQRVRGLSRGLEVRFHGPYPPADPAACPTDVVVVTSMARESYSFWLDEAYHRGVPILAAPGGALRERATDRVLTFDSTDPSDLAEKIQELRDSPARRVEMEEAAPAAQLSRGDHLKSLEASLAQAVERGPREVAEVADLKQVTYDWDRREDGFKELLRSEGWEEVLAEQSRQLRERTDSSSGGGPAKSGPSKSDC